MLSLISQCHEIPRAIPVVRCYEAAVAMTRKKKKRGYVLKWRGRASMSNKLWKSNDKKLAAKWKTCLRNMPAKDYEKLFPDSYSWVKKFADPMRTQGRICKITKGVKMWQVCRRMGFRGDEEDFSMWACLLGTPLSQRPASKK